MASLISGSRLLPDNLKHHAITVARGEIFIAGDTSAMENDSSGAVRVLQRTLCSAEEFHPLVEIPFNFYHTCSSLDCLDWTGSKAIYAAADDSSPLIYALAYGSEGRGSPPDLKLFKIDLTSGTRTAYHLENFVGDGVWNLCTLCRGTKMRVVAEDNGGGEASSTRLIVYDTILHAQAYRFHNRPELPPHTSFDECQVMGLVIDEDMKQFSIDLNLFRMPIECRGMDASICPVDELCTKWAGMAESGTLLLYDSSTGVATRYTPSRRADELIQKFVQRSIRLADGDALQLELVTEPDITSRRNGPRCDGRFRFFRIELEDGGTGYRVRLTDRSSLRLLDAELASLATPWNFTPGTTFIGHGVLYKHYGSHAILIFLRVPSLAEASFVALNKLGWGATDKDGQEHRRAIIHHDGVGQTGLNNALGMRIRWFR